MTSPFTTSAAEGPDPQKTVPAVVVGCFTMGLGVIRSLGRKGVPVTAVHYDDSDFAHHSKYVARRVAAPHPEVEAAAFVERLAALGDRVERPVLLPASDAALTTISRHHSELIGLFRLGVDDWEKSRLFIDKRETHRLAEKAGVPVPRSVSPLDLEEARTHAGTFEYPVLVKPSQSHQYTRRFGRKMTEVHDADQLMSAFREAQDAGLDVMLQEIVPGPDDLGVNYNALVAGGEVIAEFTARKIRNEPARFGSPSALVSARIPEVVPLGRAMIDALAIDGFSCSEFKFDPRNGQLKLMEVNGRHNLSSALAPACGIDFPWLHYLYLATGNPPTPVTDFREGVVWIDLIRDLSRAAGAIKSDELGVRSLVRSYRGPKTFAIASAGDPKPGIARGRNLLAGRRAGPRSTR
jgi:D-aspartate ligase